MIFTFLFTILSLINFQLFKTSSIQSIRKFWSINKNYPGLSKLKINIVGECPSIYLVDSFISDDDCEILISLRSNLASNANNTKIISLSEFPAVQLDYNKLWPLYPIIITAGLPELFKSYQLGDQLPEILKHYMMATIIATLALWIVSQLFLFLMSLPLLQKTRRNSTVTQLHPEDHEAVGRLIENAEKLICADSNTFEFPALTKYDRDGVFIAHHDSSADIFKDGWNQLGGQRLVTLICYLNDVRSGGETYFNSLNIGIQPKKGRALLFFPSDLDGNIDELTLHTGNKVIDEKYIIQIWKRENSVPWPLGSGCR